MKKILFLFLFIFCCSSYNFAQKNLTQLGKLPYTRDLSNLWGYAANGKEYAIVGVYNGVSIVDVTNPTQPVQIHFVPGVNTYWREIKTWSHYAYIVNEGGGGLTIIDLSNLPASVQTYTWTGGSLNYSTGHTIFVDENGIAYICGSNVYNGGAFFLNLNTNPINPPVIGAYTLRYVHDIFVRGDTMWSAEINNGIFSVVDVSNKTSPVVMTTNSTPGNFSHNIWLSADNKTAFTTDEINNGVIAAYDVSALNNIQELDRYQSNPGQNVAPHNVYVKDSFLVASYYRDGVVIVDAKFPYNLIQSGNFDTSPGFSGAGFNGCWGVYPYLPSGNILASDIEEGLYVLGPNYQRACYLEGTVTNASNGANLNNVLVEVLGTQSTATTAITGKYSTGTIDSGSYSIRFSRTGFITQTINNFQLQNGVLKTLNVALVPTTAVTVSGTILDSLTGTGISGARVMLRNGATVYNATTNASGAFAINNVAGNEYEIFTGKWGHKTHWQQTMLAQPVNNLTISLGRGYYDDFSLDYGWNVASTATTGAWVRVKPTISTLNGDASNPGSDVPNDFGDIAYVTGNGGLVGDNDIDNGNTILTTPVMDLSGYTDPLISFYRWFFNDGGSSTPNDGFNIKISNGITTVTVQSISANDQQQSQWVYKKFRVSDFITLTANMQMIFDAFDATPGHIVEAGLDLFEVNDSIYPPAPTASFIASATSGCPGTAITFTDISTENPDSLSWIFPGGTPSTSSAAAPIVNYPQPGIYDVTLIAINAFGADTLTLSEFIEIHDVPQLSTTSTPVACKGANTGTAIVSVTSSTSTLNYFWNNGSTNDTLAGVGAGNYSVTVTDANGCTASASVMIIEPATVLSLSTTAQEATCNNADGGAMVVATGGVSPYSYNWSNGSNNNTISGISAGFFTVSVVDLAGCERTANVSINNTGSPAINGTVQPVNCAGDSTGAIDLSVSGGVTPYDFNWSDGSTAQSLAGKAAGNYSVTLTDFAGCIATAGFTIPEPSALQFTLAKTPEHCNLADGSAAALASGGVAPYSYFWNTGDSTGNISGIPAGSYNLTITDANGCTVSAAVTVDEVVINSLTVSVTDANCGAANGAASAVVAGGKAPYQWQWSDGETSQQNDQLAAGTYGVTVTDSKGCTATESITVTDEGEPELQNVQITEPLCAGGADGFVFVSITGGAAPYTYSWSSGGDQSAEDSLAAGMYLLSVTDTNQCVRIFTVDVDEPAPITVLFSVTAENENMENGTLEAEVSGGTAPYMYNWSNGESGSEITGLSGGAYTVTITDANGCALSEPVDVPKITGVTGEKPQPGIKIFPNPVREELQIELPISLLNQPVKISILDLAGRLLKTENTSTQTEKIILKLPDLVAGSYLFVIYNGDKPVYRSLLIKE